MWKDMANSVCKVAKAMFSESKGLCLKDKEFQWQDKGVQEKIKYKRKCFKALHLGNNIENWKKYQLVKIKTKKAISKLRSTLFDGFY